MAQHDYVIDNSTGANVRADINSVLQAILSNNSGSSDPSATSPFMLFADTTNNVMKIRNAADNAFIELFQLDGTFTLEDGSATTPALAFRDDLNTGIFSSAADNFDIATGGSVRVNISSSGLAVSDDLIITDKIVHSGDTNTSIRFPATDTISFETNAGERVRITSGGRLGIGDNSPSTALHVKSADNILATFESTDADSLIEFKDNSTSDTMIIGCSGGDDLLLRTDAGNIIFKLGDNSEKARFDSSGNLGIGTTSPATSLDVTGTIHASTSIGIRTTSPQCNLHVHQGDSGSVFAKFTNSTTTIASTRGLDIGIDSSEQGFFNLRENKPFLFEINGSERMRIDSSGRVLVGSGSVSLPKGTGSGSLDLDNGTIALCVGGNDGSTGRTNSTNKNAFIVAPHYTNAEQPIPLITGSSQSSDNVVNIGGGTSLLNACTKIRFYTAANTTTTTGTERFRVNPDGEVCFGVTTTPSATQGGTGIATAISGLPVFVKTSSKLHQANTYTHYQFFNSNGAVGEIQTSGSGTSFITSSDYRLKENETAITDGITRLKQLKPYKFNFKADSSTVLDGFFAHEVSSIVPEAVTGVKDYVATEDNVRSGLAENVGDIVPQGLDHSKLVPLLVAAVQELISKVEALEAA